MFDSVIPLPKLVFLHIPKTAGQSVHNALAHGIGQECISPIRVHTQARITQPQFPSGYRMYSGHLDWSESLHLPDPKFIFSILRDPRERIASFYFYLRKEAKNLPETALELPAHLGKKAALQMSADDYFFGGDTQWRIFIDDHYDNFYCRYFGSGKIRAGAEFSALSDQQKLSRANRNLPKIDWLYSVENLGALEDDLQTLFGLKVELQNRHDNPGDRPRSEPRWPRLLDLMESDKSRARLEAFTALDIAFMDGLEL